MSDTEHGQALALAAHQASDFLAGLAVRPAFGSNAAPARLDPLDGGAGAGVAAALARFREELEPGLSGSTGPRYFGFVTGGANPAGLAGDWLAAAYNQNLSHATGSVAADVERATAAALASLFGLDPAMRGHFVSGATQSNAVALATARQHLLQARGIDAAADGLWGAPPVRVLGGAPHSSIAKAMAMLGMGRGRLETVGCLPGRSAVDPAALAQRLAESDAPTVVVASAGEVNTGDFDDIAALAALCRAHGAWLHVDGAFGAFAALSEAHAPLVRGIEQADSVTVDLHKWLNVPYDSALVYTRHPQAQRAVFQANAAYLGDSPDPLHYTPENSRRFRALPAWMVLAAYGREGVAEAVRRCCRLAERLGAGLSGLPGVRLLDEVRLNIVCFALPEPGLAARDAFLQRLSADGRVFMSPTVFAGRPAVRAAISNWSTREHDIDAALQAVREQLG